MAATKPILLHCCCAPCTVYPFGALSAAGYKPTCYFYNPNVHPYTEFARRLEAMKVFAFETGASVLIDDNYGLDGFLDVVFGKDDRCVLCYAMRMRETARLCREKQLERFTTTLLCSKHQQHDVIADVCGKAASEHGVQFVYEDFRQGRKQGIVESKRMGLYRQQYCGCIFSEQERYVIDGGEGKVVRRV
ncbi:MAG: epoxyqueuosine reductase QueH [Candidatus Coatesbacteria bacterium]|nr:epoxyqueuosine reductase QueH [Candidatus Coatesbacteria bacterium]